MATEVGEATIKLSFDTKSLSASQKDVENEASRNGSSWGSAWSVAAGNLISGGIQKITSGIIDLGKKVVEVGSEFEAQMSKVQAISGATAGEMEQLNAKASEMGATTKFTATEAGQAFEYMAMAGWKTGDMLDGVEGIMNLAAASGEELATVSDIVTDALTAMGYSAADAGHFSDVLAAASSNANTNVSMMGESFKYVGAAGGALGYTIEDTALALGLMANAGIKSSQAGTELNSIFTRLSTNTNGAQDAIRELGVEFFNSDGSARDFTSVLNELRVATANMTQEEKINFANKVAGQRAQAGLLAMLNASTDDYNKLSDAIRESDGTAKAMADTMNDNLKGSLTLLQSQWEATLLTLYNGDIEGFFSNLAGTLSQLGDVIVKAMPAVVQGFQALIQGVATQLPAFLQEIAPVLIDGIIDVVLSIADSLDEIVVGIVDLIVTIVDAIVPRLPELLLGIVNGVVNALMALTAPERLQQVLNAALTLFMAIVDAIPDILTALIAALPQIINNIVSFLTDPGTIMQLLAAGLQLFMALVEAVPQVGMQLLQSVGEVFSGIWERVKEIFSVVGEWFSNLAQGAWEGIKSALAGVGEFFSGVWDGIVGIFQGVGEWFNSIVQGAWRGVQNALSGVGNFFSGIWTNIQGVFARVGAWFQNIWDNVTSAFSRAGDAIKSGFQAVWDFIKNIFSTIGGVIKAPINGIISAINGVIRTINSIKIPDWVPGIGGASPNIPTIPMLARGGFATGATPAIIGEAGDEVVLPLEQNVESWAGPLARILADEISGEDDADGIGGGDPIVVNLNLDGTQIEQVLLQGVRRAI